jgi:hypothetical protein
MVDLAAEIRMIPVQPRLARIRRIRVSEPERTARSN